MPAGRRLVESPRVGEEHLAAGGHGTPPRNAAQFNLYYFANRTMWRNREYVVVSD